MLPVNRTLHIAIVGYGIAGIAAAIRLRRAGHRITHFERNDPPITSGAGMLLHPAGIRQLDELGLMAEAFAHGAPVRRICARTLHDRLIMDFNYDEVVPGQFALGIQRATLHQLLSSANTGRDEVRAGYKIISLDADRGYVKDAGEVRHGPFDLIVVADGANSLLRTEISQRLRDRRADSAALVGLLEDPSGAASDCLQQYFDSGRHVSVWPVGREFPLGPRRCSFAINVARKDAAAFRDRGDWRVLLARLCPRIGDLVNDRIDNMSLHIFTYRNVELYRCAIGRVVLIGDAAHSMSPQLGTGAQLAMEDAALLATAIGRHHDVSNALHAYAFSRRRQLRNYHRVSRWLTPIFQSDRKMSALIRDYVFAHTLQLPFLKRFAHALLG